ncbi:demethoxyubiquinone hydroxylase family protein [Ehrlichia minasensis]|uniref:3-demethoxyubiquinol 3-hydroxylase n=1 Tax=Ehrlichia minasensis TaxID=1242993 RepID=A0A4V2BQS0_9RICK|nr:demethoxyubiquinone hydroxylase family protein [Ehrlichia minasensis]RZB12954.1 demethoxyubiquinone hydroxylase family protein [Ehrlichia minasensis]CEI84803.1 Coq7 family protein [Ehrlichia minasensis]
MLQENNLLEQSIRVNHAGEYGAVCIYSGQELVFRKMPVGQKISEMKKQEQQHFNYFDSVMKDRKIRPTVFLPVWHVMGVMLGVTTALMGEDAAMACTVAVEEVISDHYQDQITTLDDSELKDKIIQFRNEEIEHHDTAMCHNSGNAGNYNILSFFIKKACKVAICISKVI